MLFFIDESWQLSADKKYKAGVLAAIPIPSVQFNKLSLDIFNFKKKHLGFQAGNIELKGHKIFQRFYFRLEKKGVPSNQLNLAREILTLCEQFKVKAFATVTFSQQELDLACANPNQLERPFFFLFERINQFMKENYPDLVAKLVFDDRGASTNAKISKTVSNFFHKSQVGRSFDGILKVPFFAISSENVGIQIADMVAYIIGRRFTGDRDMTIEFFKIIKETLQYKSREQAGQLPNGKFSYLRGIKVIKKDRHEQSGELEEL